MKTFIKSIFIIFYLSVLSSGILYAQQWSEAQKEVWNNVETYWDFSAKGDVEGFLSYVHDDYSGWSNQDALPVDKTGVRKYLNHVFRVRKVLVQILKPVSIKIHDDVAIVQYYYTRIITDAEGKEKDRSGRWTDILLKQGDKWVLIGDHGGSPTSN